MRVILLGAPVLVKAHKPITSRKNLIFRKSPPATCCVRRSRQAHRWAGSKEHHGCGRSGLDDIIINLVKERIKDADCDTASCSMVSPHHSQAQAMKDAGSRSIT